MLYPQNEIFGLGAVTLFEKWTLLQHSDKFLITADQAYRELNVRRNLLVQLNLKALLLLRFLQAWGVSDSVKATMHFLGQTPLERDCGTILLAKEQLWIEVYHGIYFSI